MTTLLMAALVIFGAFGYATLPVSELPNVDFPTIAVSAALPGADPETMASAVATPLESQFSTIAGIDSMTSSSTSGLDLDHHPVQARPQSSTARRRTFSPRSQTAAAQAAAEHADAAVAAQSESRRHADHVHGAALRHACRCTKVDKYAETLLARQLSTLDGRGAGQCPRRAEICRAHSGRPAPLAARNIGIDQLANAIQRRPTSMSPPAR